MEGTGRPVRLTAVFFRYLVTTGALMLVIVLLWWAALLSVMAAGWVLPASTAALEAREVAQHCGETGRFSPEGLPHYLRWVRFGSTNELVDSSEITGRQLRLARAALEEGGCSQGFWYTQYHRLIALDGGDMLVLQYDYAAPYAQEDWARTLPDFQTAMLLLLAALLLLTAVMNTRRCVGRVRRDLCVLTAATQTVARQELNVPIAGETGILELEQAIGAMERLRTSLADSLGRQWRMEAERQEELSALAHDIKTPLAVILGNAELLEEEQQGAAQRKAAAIVHAAGQIEAYVERLRALETAEARGGQAEPVPLPELVQRLNRRGEGLCAPGSLRFEASPQPEGSALLEREALERAVLNLLHNAVRFARSRVSLSVCCREGMLVFAVRDDGPGFSAQALECAGRGMYTEEAQCGSHLGLGLCTAARTARRSGGTLLLQNDAGACACLTVKAQIVRGK